MKFRKKPVVIEAVQYWHRDYAPELDQFTEICVGVNELGIPGFNLVIPTLEGDMYATEGDWIITGIKGEKYPCKPDIFEATYEPVVESNG